MTPSPGRLITILLTATLLGLGVSNASARTRPCTSAAGGPGYELRALTIGCATARAVQYRYQRRSGIDPCDPYCGIYAAGMYWHCHPTILTDNGSHVTGRVGCRREGHKYQRAIWKYAGYYD